MRILTIIFILIGLTASSQDGQYIKISKDSVTALVKDTSDYSREYINELLNWDLSDTYILNQDSLIVSKHEFGLFDTGLQKNEQYTFEGSNDKTSIKLVVKRVNFSSIEYKIEVRKGDELDSFSGSAHGGVSIFGAENDEDDTTGISYFCSEYYSNWKQPKVTIRVDSEDNNRAKVIISERELVRLSECPTLRLKK